MCGYSAETPLRDTLWHYRRIITGACDCVTPSVCPGREKRTTNLVRPCRPRTNPRWHRRRRGVGRLRRDASGGRRGADPPRGQGGVRSACCTASARGAPSSSDIILGTKREKRGTANLGERVVELEIRICCGVTQQPEFQRGCRHPRESHNTSGGDAPGHRWRYMRWRSAGTTPGSFT